MRGAGYCSAFGKPVDLILFHAVLEWVAEPQEMLRALWSVLRPGGALSLMFYNANGLLMHNMVAGNFDYVQIGMPKRKTHAVAGLSARSAAGIRLAGSSRLADNR